MSFPEALKPKKNFLLKRVGKDNDGGYLVDLNSIKNSKSLISFGINDDWSFEESFSKLNLNCKIFCYDNNLSSYFLLKNFFKNLFFFRLRFKDIYLYFKKIILFYYFFKKNSLKKTMISYNFLKNLINDNHFDTPIFLKVDIEGWEYRILNDILKIREILSGLVIEFHNVDLHLDKIVDFVNKINLELIHVHANNAGIPKLDLNNNPTVIELTFSKDPVIVSNKYITPNSLDQRNNMNLEDILITFKN